MSARSIPSRVIARYEFHVALARKTTFRRARREGGTKNEDEDEDEDEDVLRDEAKNPEGRLIRFYSPAAGRESSPLIKKRHLRTAIAGGERRGPTVAR